MFVWFRFAPPQWYASRLQLEPRTICELHRHFSGKSQAMSVTTIIASHLYVTCTVVMVFACFTHFSEAMISCCKSWSVQLRAEKLSTSSSHLSLSPDILVIPLAWSSWQHCVNFTGGSFSWVDRVSFRCLCTVVGCGPKHVGMSCSQART